MMRLASSDQLRSPVSRSTSQVPSEAESRAMRSRASLRMRACSATFLSWMSVITPTHPSRRPSSSACDTACSCTQRHCPPRDGRRYSASSGVPRSIASRLARPTLVRSSGWIESDQAWASAGSVGCPVKSIQPCHLISFVHASCTQTISEVASTSLRQRRSDRPTSSSARRCSVMSLEMTSSLVGEPSAPDTGMTVLLHHLG